MLQSGRAANMGLAKVRFFEQCGNLDQTEGNRSEWVWSMVTETRMLFRTKYYVRIQENKAGLPVQLVNF